MERKLLTATNLCHKNFGLERGNIKSHSVLVAVLSNYRKLIHKLGYDCSLLVDNEIMAFEDLIHAYEQHEDDMLLEVLDFLSCKPTKTTKV